MPVNQGTGMPAHIGPPPGPGGPNHAAPSHVAPHHHPAHSQPSHMNSQPGGHPAPSPVHQQMPNPAHQQQQTHPPSSGTPQPHIIYPNPAAAAAQISQQAMPGHPPLQPSPHTPTSPQTIYPPTVTYSMPYTQLGSQQVQQQQGMPGMTFVHAQPHTTVTHAQHQQHNHMPMVLLRQAAAPTGAPGQVPQPPSTHAATAGPHSQLQHPHHLQGHPMQGLHFSQGDTFI